MKADKDGDGLLKDAEGETSLQFGELHDQRNGMPKAQKALTWTYVVKDDSGILAGDKVNGCVNMRTQEMLQPWEDLEDDKEDATGRQMVSLFKMGAAPTTTARSRRRG